MADINYETGQSLGIGSILGESFSLTFRNFLAILAVMIAPAILIAGLAAAVFGSYIDVQTLMANPQAAANLMADPTFLVLYFVFLIISVLIGSFIYAAGIRIIFDAKTTGRANIGAAFSSGFSRAIQLFLSSLVLMIVIGLAFGLIGGVVFAAAAASESFAVVIIAQVILMIVGLWIAGCLLPFAAIVVVENVWLSAIGRSFGLTRGYRWWLVLLLFLVGLAIAVVYLLVGGAAALLTQLGTAGLVVAAIIGLALMVIVYGVGMAVGALTYARLREIKEGSAAADIGEVFS